MHNSRTGSSSAAILLNPGAILEHSLRVGINDFPLGRLELTIPGQADVQSYNAHYYYVANQAA